MTFFFALPFLLVMPRTSHLQERSPTSIALLHVSAILFKYMSLKSEVWKKDIGVTVCVLVCDLRSYLVWIATSAILPESKQMAGLHNVDWGGIKTDRWWYCMVSSVSDSECTVGRQIQRLPAEILVQFFFFFFFFFFYYFAVLAIESETCIGRIWRVEREDSVCQPGFLHFRTRLKTLQNVAIESPWSWSMRVGRSIEDIDVEWKGRGHPGKLRLRTRMNSEKWLPQTGSQSCAHGGSTMWSS